RFNADRPEAVTNLGALYAERADATRAEAQFKLALALDPGYTPAVVNLADLYRALGREDDAEKVVRNALTRAPRDAALHHVLGLSLARQKRTADAVAEFA